MEFSQDLVIYLLGLAAMWGSTMARIGSLEKKMDKHNNLVERVVKIETQEKTNCHRLDVLEECIREE